MGKPGVFVMFKMVVMTDNGCEAVSDHCKAHNDEGDCTECYDGYKLDDDNNCAWDEKNDAGPTDKGCKTWDWKNQVCS